MFNKVLNKYFLKMRKILEYIHIEKNTQILYEKQQNIKWHIYFSVNYKKCTYMPILPWRIS